MGINGRRGTGPIYIVEGILDRFAFVEILEKVMLPYARQKRGGGGFISKIMTQSTLGSLPETGLRKRKSNFWSGLRNRLTQTLLKCFGTMLIRK
jgi:hypothetical protein